MEMTINSPYLVEILENDLVETKTDVIILYGGASSGKSFFMFDQYIPLEMEKGKRNFLCVRKVARTLSDSIFNEIQKGLFETSLITHYKINKSDKKFVHVLGKEIKLIGLDDPEKIKSITPVSGVWTDIVVEEATELEERDFKQLLKRQRGKSEVKKRIWLLFNPISQEHWIYKNFFKKWEDKRYKDNSYHIQFNKVNGLNVLIMRTTIFDNDFLEEEDKRKLLEETDEYFKDVYTFGKFGSIQGVIFREGKNWYVDDLQKEKNRYDNFRYGLDFGFNPDPNAFIEVAIDERRKEILVFSEWGAIEVDNEYIANALINKTNGLLIADSAEPKSIVELNKYGLRTVGAVKGAGSIETGYKFLKKYIIRVDKSCENLIRELRTHKNKSDKNGNILPVPEDKNNHWIDALRYALNYEIMNYNKTPYYGNV